MCVRAPHVFSFEVGEVSEADGTILPVENLLCLFGWTSAVQTPQRTTKSPIQLLPVVLND